MKPDAAAYLLQRDDAAPHDGRQAIVIGSGFGGGGC
jgi:hypothetical protein